VSTQATSSSSTAAATSTSKSSKSQKDASSCSRYIFENYNKPIVLLGLSSSPENDELRRLALSLSGALVGDDTRKLKDAKDNLERSQGAGMIDNYHDNDFDNDFDEDDIDSIIAQIAKEKNEEIVGIALSAIGVDDEGPFVLDGEMIGEFIHDNILTLTTGVIVLDFNHCVFTTHSSEEVDLIRSLGSVAKRLYENEGLLCITILSSRKLQWHRK
jgi:hypothetical protein